MLTREGSEPMDDIKANWLTIKETIKREYDLTDISYQNAWQVLVTDIRSDHLIPHLYSIL